ncbi:MAG TPA: hypothetical protein VIR27_21570 [Mycobacteriales bacterium]
MTGGRALCCLAALLSVIALGGCTATVAGHGALAAGVPTPAANHGAEPGGDPTGSTRPTQGPSGGPAQPRGSGNGGGKVCPLFGAAELTRLFGEPVTADAQDDGQTCVFRTAERGGVVVTVYDYLNLRDESARDPGGKTIRIADHPAYQGKREVLVARSSDPTAAGLVIAGNLFFDDEARGNTVARKLLEKVVPRFAN